MRRLIPAAVLGPALLVLTALAFFHLRAAAQSPQAAQHPPVTIEQVDRWESELSNWGRWGKNDERGALNLITPQ